MKVYFKDLGSHIIRLNQKKNETPKLHKYVEFFSIFTTYGIIFKKISLKKKGFRRNILFVKYIRLYLYKIFIPFGSFQNKICYSLMFTPVNRYFLNFFLDSFKYSYFKKPIKLIYMLNKVHKTKYKKRIKKNILKKIKKNYNYI